jgi:hypothetical protein
MKLERTTTSRLWWECLVLGFFVVGITQIALWGYQSFYALVFWPFAAFRIHNASVELNPVLYLGIPTIAWGLTFFGIGVLARQLKKARI